MKRWIPLALLLMAVPCLADKTPVETPLMSGCIRHVMCQNQAGTGVCTRGGDEIVAKLGGRYTLTFYSTASTSSNFAIDVYTNDQGYDAYSGGEVAVGQVVNTAATQMTNSNRAYSVTGLFEYVWVNCATNDDNVVNVTMLSCPMSR